MDYSRHQKHEIEHIEMKYLKQYTKKQSYKGKEWPFRIRNRC